MASKRRGRPPVKKGTKGKLNSNRKTKNYELEEEIIIILLFAVFLLLFLCNFGIIGTAGDFISNILFGIFGLASYIFPVVCFILIAFKLINTGSRVATRKTVFGSVLFFTVSMVFELINGITKSFDSYNIKELYLAGVTDHVGGGIISGSLVYLLNKYINIWGTIVLIILLSLISVLIITEKSLKNGVKHTGEIIAARRNDSDKEDRLAFYEERQIELQKKRELKKEKELKAREEKEHKKQAKDDEKILRKNQKAVGITENTTLYEIKDVPSISKKGDMHEISLDGFDPSKDFMYVNEDDSFKNKADNTSIPEDNEVVEPVNRSSFNVTPPKILNNNVKDEIVEKTNNQENVIVSTEAAPLGKYVFPPISKLKKNSGKHSGDSKATIEQTAIKLQQTLATFGVNATVTEVSQGPTVTRFELQPEMGVKVSRIKSLSDDIKLNLAAADIRIEAPIPGKAAIGIEVPNKNAQPVLLGDMIDSNEFKNSKSMLTFAVGKDISGKNIVYDIDKFPHLLIAGATGSGKSVCINTLIMSIIYKAHPNDVKLIMIDPKVVELSVYNGIPHLLLPVVTDAKKAAATLNYAVNEMMERYQKFAALNTRDLDGYNEAVSKAEPSEIHKKLPRIVIIVDELADLIMVAKNDVEDAICRLAQLARAAGIHLIIATQRPSVDVITGLIKANMPSRLAFAVSSGVDSRTILDMSGAEELLGKGDMLFFPKGLKKPVRLQGGFVSDGEVNEVVKFLSNNCQASYDATITDKIDSIKSSSGAQVSDSDNSFMGYDDMFIEAGRFVITSEKASIGNMQRKFKMGFNRAARIMDQLAEAGVVGPEVGTKPREILMSLESFENYIENNM